MSEDKKCEHCGLIFETETTEDEAMSEAVDKFGEAVNRCDLAVVCGPCYTEIMSWGDAKKN